MTISLTLLDVSRILIVVNRSDNATDSYGVDLARYAEADQATVIGRFVLGMLRFRNPQMFDDYVSIAHQAAVDMSALDLPETDYNLHLSLAYQATQVGDPGMVEEADRLLRKAAAEGHEKATALLKVWPDARRVIEDLVKRAKK